MLILPRRLQLGGSKSIELESFNLYANGSGDSFANVNLGAYSPDRLITLFISGRNAAQWSAINQNSTFSVDGDSGNSNWVYGYSNQCSYGFDNGYYFGGMLRTYHGTKAGSVTVSFNGSMTDTELGVAIFRNVGAPSSLRDSGSGTSSGTTDPTCSLTTDNNGLVLVCGWSEASSPSDYYWVTVDGFTGLSGITELDARDGGLEQPLSAVLAYKILGGGEGSASQSVGINYTCESQTAGAFSVGAGAYL